MQLKFTKMHGAGNDFMVVRWPKGTAIPAPAVIRGWADRRRGVGFDQLLVLEDGPGGDAHAGYRIFNADGGEVEQCGNGARCLAQVVAAEAGLSEVRLSSPSGIVEARLTEDGDISVSLGEPRFSPSADFLVGYAEGLRYHATLDGHDVEFGAVSLGNPHVVIPVDSVESAPVGILGEVFQQQPAFPSGVNVGFAETVDAGRLRLRVFERGVGETLACGTGAAAAAVIGMRWGCLAERVRVELPGGTLGVEWRGPDRAVWLSGRTTTVYEGQISL